ncbi:MAG: hypothetical protein JETCAE03_11910 [Ignavibacteriaceae bacterium]|nr:MAG: hypothetical protein JETCAE03_11910 [Ignavibacteriaceae bacterium]
MNINPKQTRTPLGVQYSPYINFYQKNRKSSQSDFQNKNLNLIITRVLYLPLLKAV